ncbi:MAG: tetratricopeptide repeat protein [Candidatus Acidiferrales bacterium]
MVRHMSRKELKTDEIHDTLAQGVEGVLSHQKTVGVIVAVIVVVALAVGGWKIYTERQTVKASAAFDDAMKIFQARIMKPGEPVEPGEPTYMEPAKKFMDASKKFGAVAETYPRTRPGELAHYYAALSLERINQDMEAKKWLEGLTSSSSEDFVALAKNEIAQIDDRNGKGQDAVKLYEELLAKPSILVPKPIVLLSLAEHYRQTTPPDETQAAKFYNEIKTEFPDTRAAEQADQELALLPAGKS